MKTAIRKPSRNLVCKIDDHKYHREAIGKKATIAPWERSIGLFVWAVWWLAVNSFGEQNILYFVVVCVA